MTTAKDVAIAVGAGGKFLLEAYFAVMDDKEAKNPAVPATPRFTEVLLAAGSKLPSLEEALANLMHPTAATPAAATPAVATPAATPLLAAVEARIVQADAAIEARMAGLQLRMQAIEVALRTLAQFLPPPTPPPTTPKPPTTPEPTVPPDVVVVLDAREGRHHQLLTEGEEALGTIEGLVEVLTVRVEASVASGGDHDSA